MAKIALVTGANRGIGFEVARQLGKAGMTVILGARDREKGAEAHSVLDKEGLRVRSQLLDLLNPGTARMAADFIGVKYGRLDVLVNNAGGFYDQEATPSKTSLKYLREALENNLIGTLSVIQAMLPLLLKSSSARIVNVTSGAGSFGDAGFGLAAGSGAPAYALSKLALNGLTVKLAAELKDTKILVNSVCPGFTATFPGAKEQGARPVEEGAASVAWAALIPDDGPRGGFFRDGKPIPW